MLTDTGVAEAVVLLPPRTYRRTARGRIGSRLPCRRAWRHLQATRQALRRTGSPCPLAGTRIAALPSPPGAGADVADIRVPRDPDTGVQLGIEVPAAKEREDPVTMSLPTKHGAKGEGAVAFAVHDADEGVPIRVHGGSGSLCHERPAQPPSTCRRVHQVQEEGPGRAARRSQWTPCSRSRCR